MADELNTSATRDPATSKWHIDKRVPLALIVVLTLQFGGAVYWATTIEQRTLVNQKRIAKLETQMDPVRLLLERIDTRLGNIEESLRGNRRFNREGSNDGR